MEVQLIDLHCIKGSTKTTHRPQVQPVIVFVRGLENKIEVTAYQ
jgi:hypothetical protein